MPSRSGPVFDEQSGPESAFGFSRDLFPFDSRFLEVAGCRVHYVDEGRGPVLLMLHGNPTWCFLYRKLIERLRSSFRCIALDYPGFGLSRPRAAYGFTPREHAEVVCALVSRLRLQEVTIVAQDWGGPIGLDWATRNPDRVRAVVLGNTWAWSLRGQWRYELFSRVMGGPVGRAATWLFNFVPRFFLLRGHSFPLSPEARRAYLAPLTDRPARRPTTVFPRELIASDAFLSGIAARLPTLQGKPALLLWAGRDFAFREPELARFQRVFPWHTTVRLPSAGHFWQEDAADEAVEAILSWRPSPSCPGF